MAGTGGPVAPGGPVVRVEMGQLRRFAAAVMEAAGLHAEDAERVADSLVYADARGLASHGVSRLPIYVKRLRLGLVTARPQMRWLQEDGATALLDAGNGPGAVAATLAMDKAVELARRYGLGACAVRQSNHCGALAYYTERVAQISGEIFIAFAATNANRNVAPWGGREAVLGTNPFSLAVPMPGRPPFVLDMATSAVARGKIILAAKTGRPIPEGWALDSSGQPTRDAREALKGILLPMAGPKGYGLAAAVDVLCGVLAGAAFGRDIGALYDELDRPQGVGHFMLVLDAGRWMAPARFLERMGAFAAQLKQTPPAAGFAEVLLPGEPEARAWQVSAAQGVALAPEVVEELRALAEELGVAALPGQPAPPARPA